MKRALVGSGLLLSVLVTYACHPESSYSPDCTYSEDGVSNKTLASGATAQATCAATGTSVTVRCLTYGLDMSPACPCTVPTVANSTLPTSVDRDVHPVQVGCAQGFKLTGTAAYVQCRADRSTVNAQAVFTASRDSEAPQPAPTCEPEPAVPPPPEPVAAGQVYALTRDNAGEGNVLVFDIDDKGQLSANGTTPSIAAGKDAQSIVVSPRTVASRMAHVSLPNFTIGGSPPPGGLATYTVAADGSLTAATGSSMALPEVRDLQMTGDGKILLASNFDTLASSTGNFASGASSSVALGTTPGGFCVLGSNAYVGTNAGIQQFSVAADGTIAALTPPSAGSANYVAPQCDAAGKHVYALAGSGIATFDVAGADDAGSGGRLVAHGADTAVANYTLAGLVLDPKGKHLFALTLEGDVVLFAIGANGDLSPMNPATLTPSAAVMAGTFDASGAYVYLSTADSILEYGLGTTGLTPLATPSITTGAATVQQMVAP